MGSKVAFGVSMGSKEPFWGLRGPQRAILGSPWAPKGPFGVSMGSEGTFRASTPNRK